MTRIEKSLGMVGPCVRAALAFVLFLLAVPVAEASWVCSIDQAYPEVSELSLTDGRLIATLGTRFSSPETQRNERVQLVLGANGDWTRLPDQAVLRPVRVQQACMTPPSDDEWLRRNYPDKRSRFDQTIEVCTTDGQTTWGGIGFHGEENGWGVGGLVRQDRVSGEFEYVRPYGLRDYSVSTLQSYGGRLFFGRTSHGECIGPEPGFGLSYYQVGRDVIYDVPEVCGFAIRSLLVFDDELWVASDLGLARATAFDRGYAFEEFWNRLSELRPAFVSRYLRRLHGHSPVPNQ